MKRQRVHPAQHMAKRQPGSETAIRLFKIIPEQNVCPEQAHDVSGRLANDKLIVSHVVIERHQDACAGNGSDDAVGRIDST